MYFALLCESLTLCTIFLMEFLLQIVCIIKLLKVLIEEYVNPRLKANKAETKVLKSVMDEKDEFDEMADDKNLNKSVSERLGLSGEKKSTAGSKKMKQTTLKVRLFEFVTEVGRSRDELEKFSLKGKDNC